jgi:phosphonate transport system substrate-binding protein
MPGSSFQTPLSLARSALPQSGANRGTSELEEGPWVRADMLQYAVMTHPTSYLARYSLWCVLLLAALAGLDGCSPKSASPPLKVGVIPYDKVDTVREAYTPFAAYLAKKIGRTGSEVFVTPEYAGVIQALRSDQIDCAYLNPLSYVLAVDQFNNTPEHLVPIAMPYYHHSLTYRGDIFVRADSGIKSMKDFRGRTFAFADPTSTSGYLYPAGMMKEAGLDPAKDVKSVNISGGGSVMAVYNKLADGGASYDGSIERALPDPSQARQILVIAKTDAIPNGMFVARGNLPPNVIDALKKAMADINSQPEGVAALKVMEFDKWVPADDHAFDSVRKKARILGLNLQSLDTPPKG